jgi:imidazolonepropionase-like amidohydrolase
MRRQKTGVSIFVAALLAAGAVSASDQIPAPPQKQPIALVGGAIHTVSGQVIEKGVILFDKGKIVDMGTAVAVPSNALRVDVTGKHVYPALIETNSQIGLVEINSVRGTVDLQETGTINPNVRAETGVNPDSERIPVTRSNGIALAVIRPEGGIIAGMAACIMLDGWTWEAMTLKAPVAMMLSWPGAREQRGELERAFRDSRAYKTAREAARKKAGKQPKTDLRWEAMIPVLDGRVPVWVWVSGARGIEEAVEWADREKVRIVIAGSAEAPRVADLLKRRNIPVIVTPVLRLPNRPEADYDEPFTLPAELYRAGVRFCIGGGSPEGGERNLPYHAAMAAAFGLPKDEALCAVTQYAAEITGIGDRAGTLEKGKDATLMVTTGDPLEVVTTVERLYIQGRETDLSDKQKILYRKYREKYRQIAGE